SSDCGGIMSYPDPRYLGDSGEVAAVFHPASQHANVKTLSAGYHYIMKGEDTKGDFGLYRADLQPHGRGAMAHFHRTMSESFYVISGIISLYNGDSWTQAKTGDFLYVPPGGIHGFQNDSNSPASMLILFVPGAPREEYFEAIAKAISGHSFTDEE